MRFQVPQFIDVEDKIFGPLTLKQFIYLAGGGGLVVIFFKFLPGFLAFIISIPTVVLSLALAFYKVNNKPFISVLESFVKYFTNSRLYIWKKEDKKITKKTKDGSVPELFVPKLSQSKLKDMSWNLEVKKEEAPTEENRIET